MREHDLKTHPEEFLAVLDGRKPFDVRQEDDRHFEIGDHLLLREYIPTGFGEAGPYTGRQVRRQVTYILRGPRWGIPVGTVVLGFGQLGPANPRFHDGEPFDWDSMPNHPLHPDRRR